MRDYWTPDAQWNRKSRWVSMKKGERHYLEARHIEADGEDHMVVGVEVRRSPSAKPHHHSMKEIQQFEVTTTHIFEKTRFNATNISNATSGRYVIAFANPKKNGKFVLSKPINDNCTALDFKDAVKEYYKETFGSDISVGMRTFEFNVTIPWSNATLP
jgi:hypothetical protein